MSVSKRVKMQKRNSLFVDIVSWVEVYFRRLTFLKRSNFEKFIYTDVYDSIEEIKKRQENIFLSENISQFLNNDIPEPFCTELRAVLGRHLATPNFESSRFLIISDALEIKPLFFEYYQDIFRSLNEEKRHLAKMVFVDRVNRVGQWMTKHTTVFDMSRNEKKPLLSINTIWGENLKDFHHKLFEINYKDHVIDDFFYDASDWITRHGKCPKKYYPSYLSLFIRNGILFENFLVKHKGEKDFINKVFLPSFIKIKNTFGIKPLIVALSPTNIEEDKFWFYYNEKIKKYVYNKVTEYEHSH